MQVPVAADAHKGFPIEPTCRGVLRYTAESPAQAGAHKLLTRRTGAAEQSG
jgi:hypothetical protein